MERLLRFVQDPSYRRLLLDAVRSYFTLSRAEQAEEQRLLQSRYGEVNEMLHTELGRLEERARREGEAQARQEMQTELGRLEERARREGEAQARREMQTELGRLEERARREGEAQARQQALLEILEVRFGPVPEAVAGRIQQVQDLTVLRELTRRAAGASRLEEVEALLGP